MTGTDEFLPMTRLLNIFYTFFGVFIDQLECPNMPCLLILPPYITVYMHVILASTDRMHLDSFDCIYALFLSLSSLFL